MLKSASSWHARFATACAVVVLLMLAPVSDVLTAWGVAAAQPIAQGFGAATPGGSAGTTVRVTNLNNSGPGSLRDAVSAGGRTVVFDVAGDIVLTDYIRVRGAFITIDGSTAPPPGITLRNHGLSIQGSDGAHDVIVSSLRVRNAAKDGIRVAYGAYNVLIDHVSVHGSGDGNLDITESHDVTVAWSILAEPALDQKNMLIKYNPARVTLHHNLFVSARQRNPQARIDDAGTPATDTTLDMRNNVVWAWPGGYGTLIWYGPRANVVNNLYSFPQGSAAEQAKALEVRAARAYVQGNVSADDPTRNLDAAGTEAAPFPAPAVDTQPACQAAYAVVEGAGVRPLDAVDQQYVSTVTLPACTGAAQELPDLMISAISAPGTSPPGSVISITEATRNTGSAPAAPSKTRFYLATGTTPRSGDLLLGERSIPPVEPGATSSSSTSLTIPAATPAGTYYIAATADADSAVAEVNEANNSRTTAIVIGSIQNGATPSGKAALEVSDLSTRRSGTSSSTVALKETVKNGGSGVSGSSTVKFYLSRNREVDATGLLLGSRAVAALGPGESSVGSTTVTIPAAAGRGRFYIVAILEAAAADAPRDDDDLSTSRSFRIE